MTNSEQRDARPGAGRRPRVVAVVNLKGGTGKTTTAAFLGHAWAAAGERVTFVDADHPQVALSRWAELASWDLPVMGLGSKQLTSRARASATSMRSAAFRCACGLAPPCR